VTEHRVLDSREGPDSTVSAIELSNGVRELVIDGFQTSADGVMGHYMTWMGRLPMILHESPRRALVICFGIGQTADAVRDESPESLDIVELSPAVLELAPQFPANRGVLRDPRVRAIVMDGRAWLRRARERYDVVTLEPMSPHFAGTNALYSTTFYRLIEARLRPGGVIAQWLPLHLVSPRDAASIAKTFIATFPRAWLWIDPVDHTGIIVGTIDGRTGEAPRLPGLDREIGSRNLADEAILAGFVLGPSQLAQYAEQGEEITDDNLLLTYGSGRRQARRFRHPAALHRVNLEVIERLRAAHR
jgi:spermidine synthase